MLQNNYEIIKDLVEIMKGRNFLIITSILIIVGALTGFALNIIFFHGYKCIPGITICALLLTTGILGLAYCNRSALICIVFGIIMSVLSIASIPVMFWIGNGTAPIWIFPTGFAFFIILRFYLEGVHMNKRFSSEKEYWYTNSLQYSEYFDN